MVETWNCGKGVKGKLIDSSSSFLFGFDLCLHYYIICSGYVIIVSFSAAFLYTTASSDYSSFQSKI